MSQGAQQLGTQPSGLPPANLADALAPAPTQRGRRLAGRLAPARLPAGPSTDDREQSRAPSEDRGRPADASPQHSPAVDQSSRGAARAVIVYLPVSLRDRLRKVTADRDATYTQLVLDAIDATHEQLAPMLTQQRPARAQSLFQRTATPRRRRHDEPHVQVSLRLVPEDLAVIDRLVADLGAGSRSHLVATALHAHFQ